MCLLDSEPLGLATLFRGRFKRTNRTTGSPARHDSTPEPASGSGPADTVTPAVVPGRRRGHRPQAASGPRAPPVDSESRKLSRALIGSLSHGGPGQHKTQSLPGTGSLRLSREAGAAACGLGGRRAQRRSQVAAVVHGTTRNHANHNSHDHHLQIQGRLTRIPIRRHDPSE